MPKPKQETDPEFISRRRQLNKEAAWRYRKKRKVLIAKMEKERDRWRDNYAALVDTFNESQKRVVQLEAELAFARAQNVLPPLPLLE